MPPRGASRPDRLEPDPCAWWLLDLLEGTRRGAGEGIWTVTDDDRDGHSGRAPVPSASETRS